MKLYVLLSFAVAAAVASPTGGYSAMARNSGSEDCICLESEKSLSADGTVVGTYSYVDPVGSTITVSYTHGAEGYAEKRKITKAKGIRFTAFQDTAPVKKIVSTVTTSTSSFSSAVQSELEPALGRAISLAVAQFGSVPLAEVSSQVEESLYPSVLRAVRFYLTEQRVSSVEASDLAERVTRRLTVLITNAVKARYDADRVVFPRNVDSEEILRAVVNRFTVVIKETVETIRQSVTFPIEETEVTTLTQQVVSEPIVAQVITSVEQNNNVVTTQTGSTRPSSEAIIAKVLAAIKPIIVKAVRDHQSKQVVTSVTTTTQQHTSAAPLPIVAAPVTTVVVEEEFSKALVTDLVLQLQPVIARQVKTLFSSQSALSLSNEQLAQQLVDGMRADIRAAIVSTTAGDATYTEAKIDRLYQRLLAALRPVVLQTLTAFRQVQVKQVETTITSETFVGGLVDAVVAFIREQRIVENAISNNNGNNVVSVVIERVGLDGYVRNYIQGEAGLVVSDSFYTSQAYLNLVARIRAALQTLIPQFVAEYRSAQTTRVENQVLSQTLVQTVVDGVSTGSSLQSVVAAVTLENGLTEAQVVERVLAGLNVRIVVEDALRAAGIQIPQGFYTSSTYQTLVTRVRTGLTRLITQLVASARQDQNQITNLVVDGALSSLRPAVASILESYATTSDQEIYEEVVAVLRATLFQSLRQTVGGGAYADYGYAGSAAAEEFFYRQILLQIRQQVMTLIRTIRAEMQLAIQQKQQQQQQQKKKVTTTTTTVTSSSSSSGAVKNIFGVSGQNTVRVETPGFQYAYEHK